MSGQIKSMAAGALAFVDGVSYAGHGLPDGRCVRR